MFFKINGLSDVCTCVGGVCMSLMMMCKET